LQKDWLCCGNGALLTLPKYAVKFFKTLPRRPFGRCGAAVVGCDGCPAALEILMTKTKAKAKPTRNATTNKPARKKAVTLTVKAKRVVLSTPEKATAKLIPTAVATAMTKPGDRADSKQSRVLAMLRASDGTTIEAIMHATSWQQHSVRGFLAGVVRKKLNLDLDSEVIDGTRRYRIKQAAMSGGTNNLVKAA
jgi:hypothetical protein